VCDGPALPAALNPDATYPSLRPISALSKEQRAHVACGFALLQLQRGAVGVSPTELAHAPDWAVVAHRSLNMLLPALTADAPPTSLDILLFDALSVGDPQLAVRRLS
jgi:hypothetical protein